MDRPMTAKRHKEKKMQTQSQSMKTVIGTESERDQILDLLGRGYSKGKTCDGINVIPYKPGKNLNSILDPYEVYVQSYDDGDYDVRVWTARWDTDPTACGMSITDPVDTLREALQQAREIISSGTAIALLEDIWGEGTHVLYDDDDDDDDYDTDDDA